MKAVRVFALLLLASSLVSAAEVIDRVVAVVNRGVILQSDWDEALRYEAFMDGKPLADLTRVDAKAALDRLIDRQLLRQQMQGFHGAQPTPEDVNSKLQEVRKLYPEGNTEPGWRAALARYGLSEASVNQRVARQLKLMQFIEMRLRPSTKISQQSVEDYYREKLLPQLGAADRKAHPTTDVSAKIEELLTQEKIDELLTSWLRELREQAEIRIQAGPEVLLGSAQTAENTLQQQVCASLGCKNAGARRDGR